MPDFGGGEDREPLRGFLRQWEAPGAPPEVEEALRLALRRRARGRRVIWLAAAAAVALVAAGVVLRLAVPATPPTRVTASPPPATAAASPLPALPVDPEPAPTVASRRPPSRPKPMASPQPDQVVVEPDQAELLARFGRDLQALPDVALQDRTAPMAAALWEPVSDEWPLVHWSHSHTSEDKQ
jgi:hypothetical protein